MPPFNIPLKNEKTRLYHRLTWLIIIVNLLLLIYLGLITVTDATGYAVWACQLVIVSMLVVGQFHAATTWRNQFLLVLLLLCFCWVLHAYYWLAALVLLFGLLQWSATRKLVVRVSEDGVSYPSTPAKKWNWSSLANMLVKDGLFTLDFKNNRFIQQQVEESSTLNEEEFNEFCRQHLK